MTTITFDLLFTIAACASLLVLWLASAAVLPWHQEELDEVEQDLGQLLPLQLLQVHDADDRSGREGQIQTGRGPFGPQRDGALPSFAQLLVQEHGHRVPRRPPVGRVLLGVGR